MATQLEENLTCPICLGIYIDPLVLGCSHSFCVECLRSCWEDKAPGRRECPLCRRRVSKDPPPNLALRNVCEAFLQASAPASDQQRAACGDSGARANPEPQMDQRLCSIAEDIEQQKKRVTKNLLLLRGRLKGLAQTEAQCEGADGFLSAQVNTTEELIREEFKRLRWFLQQQEDSRLSEVRKEARQKGSSLKETMEAVREQRAAVNKAISDATRRLQDVPKNQPPNRLTLRRYTSLVELTQRPLEEEELQLGSGALLDQAKHLGNLDFHIWSSLRPEVRYCPVVLDPNTVAADLSLSADLRSMSQQGAPRLPLNAERLSGSYWAVLGAEGLNVGIHSWDVDVSGSGYWAVGVASRCERLPGVLSELWRVSWSLDGLEAGTLTGRPTVLPLARGPHTVRVVLDLDRRDLSFFAPGTTSPLHSFTLPPTGGALFPYFFIGDHGRLRLIPQDIQVSAGTNTL